MSIKKVLITGVVFIFLAILLGAFGAHTLKSKLEPSALASFEVGVRFQMFQGIGLLCLAIIQKVFEIDFKRTLMLQVIGTVLFSFSIYLLALKDLIGVKLAFLGPVTPIGGSIMLIAWLLAIKAIWKWKA